MGSRSRKLLTTVTVSVDGGTPVRATRKEVEAAFHSLPKQLGRSVLLKRFSGEMSFTYSDGKYEVACETFYVPYPVALTDALAIARIFAKLEMLHEGYTWRERE